MLNVDGLKPRSVPPSTPLIQDILHEKNMLFGMLTETWLRDHMDAELHIPNYILFRSDRIRPRKRRGRDHGGVAMYIRSDMAASADPVLKFSNGVVELLCVHIKSENIVLCVLYRQPNDPTGGHMSKLKEFKQALNKLRKTLNLLPNPTPDIILGGDFNLPNVKWPEADFKTGSKKIPEEHEMLQELKTLFIQHHLSQYIYEPTHYRGNTLDLICTNNPMIIHGYNIEQTICSPHHLIECSTTYSLSHAEHSQTPKPPTKSIFDQLNFHSPDIDWKCIENEFEQVDWKKELNGVSPKEKTDKFIEISKRISEKYVPKRKSYTNNSKPIIPRHRRKLMRRRTKLNRRLRATTSESCRKKIIAEGKDIEKSLMQSYHSQHLYEEDKAVNAIKCNPKYFYSYANKYSKTRSTVGPLSDGNNIIITSAKKMADIFAEVYKTFFTKPLNMTYPYDYSSDIPTLSDIHFEETDIIKAIEEISANAAAGPDRFPAILLKKCKNIMAKPLYLIWRESIDTNNIPDLLKQGNITPIHKGGNRDSAKNYRPVTLTSHLIKVYEKVVRNHLVSFIERNNLFNPNQHGFRAGRSCLSQLLAHQDNITRLLEMGKNVDVVYLDFSKAFDKVDFDITLWKLHQLGIRGKLHAWIHNFLVHRQQSVVIDGYSSDPFEPISGVPQGSVLGPLLFLILLGDIDKDVSSAYVSSFADDTRISHGITSQTDVNLMQHQLSVIYNWSTKNNMYFNSDKFNCLRYGPNNEIKENTKYSSNNGKDIECNEHVLDLGVTLSADASFKEHIRLTVDAAQKKCGWILRTFSTRDSFPLMTLWKSLVQPKLDYCSQLWSPSSIGQIQDLEMVFRSYARKIKGLSHMSYWDQLKSLNIYSMERRRERYQIIYVWRILESQVPNLSNIDGICSQKNSRRGRLCIVPPINRSASPKIRTLREGSLSVKGPQLFNCMPDHIRNITNCTVDHFKSRLDSFLSQIPDQPRIPNYEKFCVAESNSLTDMAKMQTITVSQFTGVPPGRP